MKDRPATTTPETAPIARGVRVGMVVSRYHRDVMESLEDGARTAFKDAGGADADIVVLHAAGAFELPVLAAALARRADVHAVVALGCVVRGETRHDRYLSQAVTDALARVALDASKPVGYGFLTVETPKQARARAGGAQGNKGRDAMVAALLTLAELRKATA